MACTMLSRLMRREDMSTVMNVRTDPTRKDTRKLIGCACGVRLKSPGAPCSNIEATPSTRSMPSPMPMAAPTSAEPTP